jgi:carbonic anhydrase
VSPLPSITEPFDRPSPPTDELLRRNDAYASALATIDLPQAPAKRLAIVTCMDARIDPYRILGLEEGDAHVIRNAGGVVTDDVIRSLTISQRRLRTNEVMLIMHTDCGMQGLADTEFRDRVQSESGVRPAWATEGFFDVHQAVREGILRLRTTPFVPHAIGARGFVYDVRTHRLREVA